MPKDIESRETLKNTLSSIRRQCKLDEFDRAKSLRRQYAAGSVMHCFVQPIKFRFDIKDTCRIILD